MESHVLAEEDLSLRVVDLVDDSFSHAVFDEVDWSAEQLFQWCHHRPEGKLGINLAIGPSQVREQHNGLGVVAGQILESRNGA